MSRFAPRAQALETLARKTSAPLSLVQQAIAADAQLAERIDAAALRAAFDADAAARQANTVAAAQWTDLRARVSALSAEPLRHALLKEATP